ncbi:helix-turn-helix transcriptional regulator [Micromonospora robiginosa]|uniref:Helix-turn-helix transcriptional regulator n=1 Tax=Micromonospora robiginosa TaxID=2749844 RepID=A0A7L6B3M5_9ACTN|nr:helix-turn-helix transcriptional regulator [Micromonospora ferruginea]QLQ36355.1 helix-turn-helix transcriptional regulator [Micromonospora ferruginea]
MSVQWTDRAVTRRPATRHVIETDDPERAHHLIARTYGDHRARISGRRDQFRYRRSSVVADDLEIHETRYTLRLRTDTQPYSGFAAVTVRQGRYGFLNRQEELYLGPNATGRFPDAASTLLAEDVSASVVRLPMPRIAEVAATRTGLPTAEFRFTALAPLSPTLTVLWQSTAAFLRRHLADDTVADSTLVRAELMNLAAATAVSVFPNSTMTQPYLPGPPGLRPALVRRAADYIEAHAGQPLTVARIAAACEVGPRALQVAFQRHHGQSPMAFLRTVRLHRAHRDLAQSHPGQTVAETARRWGWAHAGRFARAYRDTYGCHPGDTLRGAGAVVPPERNP